MRLGGTISVYSVYCPHSELWFESCFYLMYVFESTEEWLAKWVWEGRSEEWFAKWVWEGRSEEWLAKWVWEGRSEEWTRTSRPWAQELIWKTGYS